MQSPVIDVFFEDLVPGEIREFGHHLVTKDAVIAFAKAYDPQPFHLDEAAGDASMLGGLSASGWHSACILMRMGCDAWINRTASWGGPGVQSLKWLKPVRPGDTLRARLQIIDKRQSQSRPQMGLVTLHNDLINQHGETVMTQDNVVMIGLRGQTPAPIHRAPATGAPPRQTEPTSVARCRYQDIVIGETIVTGSFQFTAENIVEFARQFDPQPFHMSEAAAKASHFGALAASGWHTACANMRLLVDARHRALALEPDPTGVQFGPSPGIRDLAWPHPVYAGDTITFTMEAISKRPTSRPGWGLVESRNTGVNQNGQAVFSMIGAGFYPLPANS